MDDTNAIVMCDECPCPPPPFCVDCSYWSWVPGYESTNYMQIWGFGCEDDCENDSPRLLGTYDMRAEAEGSDWTGCVWYQWDQDGSCRTWYGMGRWCAPIVICREKVCDGPCLARMTTVVSECVAKNFYYYRGTGWLFSTTDPSLNPFPSIFHWITYAYNDSTGRYDGELRSLDCLCSETVVARGSFQSAPQSLSVFSYSFTRSELACDTDCAATVSALIDQANAAGWTLLGEGVLVRKTSAQYSCYRFDLSVVKAQVIADTGSSFVYVTCDCTRSVIDTNYSLYAFVDYQPCSCVDMREVILSNPSMFGVVDVSFGDDTVYTVDRSSSGGTISTTSCIRSSYGWDAYWCDYRDMYVIFDNTCIGMPSLQGYGTDDVMLIGFKPDGTWMSGYSPFKYVGVSGGTISFDGKIQPFTNTLDNQARWPHWGGPGVGAEWMGLTIRWTVRNSRDFGGGPECETVWSESQADDLCAQWSSASCPYGYDSFEAMTSDWSAFISPMVSSGPSYNYTDHACQKSYDSYNEEWKACAPYREWANDGLVFNINFVVTNKGFLINGGSGYSDTLNVPGFTNTASYGCPGSSVQAIVSEYVSRGTATMCYDETLGDDVVCPQGTVMEIPFGGAITSIPMYDMSFHTEVRESMGGCEDDDWWDPIINPED